MDDSRQAYSSRILKALSNIVGDLNVFDLNDETPSLEDGEFDEKILAYQILVEIYNCGYINPIRACREREGVWLIDTPELSSLALGLDGRILWERILGCVNHILNECKPNVYSTEEDDGWLEEVLDEFMNSFNSSFPRTPAQITKHKEEFEEERNTNKRKKKKCIWAYTCK